MDASNPRDHSVAYLPLWAGSVEYQVPVERVERIEPAPLDGKVTSHGQALAIVDLSAGSLTSVRSSRRILVVVEHSPYRMGWLVDRTGPIHTALTPPARTLEVKAMAENFL